MRTRSFTQLRVSLEHAVKLYRMIKPPLRETGARMCVRMRAVCQCSKKLPMPYSFSSLIGIGSFFEQTTRCSGLCRLPSQRTAVGSSRWTATPTGADGRWSQGPLTRTARVALPTERVCRTQQRPRARERETRHRAAVSARATVTAGRLKQHRR